MSDEELRRIELLLEHAPGGVAAEAQWVAARLLLAEVHRLRALEASVLAVAARRKGD